jgi:hypothetical protein
MKKPVPQKKKKLPATDPRAMLSRIRVLEDRLDRLGRLYDQLQQRQRLVQQINEIDRRLGQ